MMLKMKKAKSILLGAAMGGIPLVTTGECNPRTGAFSFFRGRGHDVVTDVIVDSGYYVQDGYYDQVIVYDDCFDYGCY